MTQILERKVIDRILEDAEIEDVPVTIEPERRSRPWTSRPLRPRRSPTASETRQSESAEEGS